MEQLEQISNSYELFKVINEHRIEAGIKPMKYHRDLVEKIKDELGEEVCGKKLTLPIKGVGQGAREFEAYELSRRDVVLVAMRESKQVRASVYDYIEELEHANRLMSSILLSKGYLPQELGAQVAGIQHPRKFAEFLRNDQKCIEWLEKHNYFTLKRVGKSKDAVAWRWSQEGFRYILKNSDYFNKRVKEKMQLQKKGLLSF